MNSENNFQNQSTVITTPVCDCDQNTPYCDFDRTKYLALDEHQCGDCGQTLLTLYVRECIPEGQFLPTCYQTGFVDGAGNELNNNHFNELEDAEERFSFSKALMHRHKEANTPMILGQRP